MTMQLVLPPQLEERLRREAERQRLPPDALTLRILEKHLPPADRAAAAVAMLQEWIAEDQVMTEEERAANAAVLQAIDKDRLSDRKLFTNVVEVSQE